MKDVDPVALLKAELAGRTFVDVAKQVGCSYQHVQAVVSGKRRPGPAILKHLGLKKSVRYTRADE